MTFTDSDRKTSFSFLHSFICASPFVATSEIQYVCIGLSVQILKTESQRLNMVKKMVYNLARPLIRDVLFSFHLEVPVTNWAAQ